MSVEDRLGMGWLWLVPKEPKTLLDKGERIMIEHFGEFDVDKMLGVNKEFWKKHFCKD